MDDATLTRMLAETLEDQRLSRSEARALRAVIDDLPGDDAHVRHRARARAFELARAEAAAGDGALALAWLEEVVKALWPLAAPPARAFRGEAHFSPDGNPRERLVRLLASARRSADICVFTITDDEVSQGIVAAVKRGVAVRVLSDDQKEGDVGSDIGRLARRGVEVRLDRSRHHMHHKFAVFDGEILVNGSYNWTRSANDFNAENILVTGDPDLVSAFAREFEALWNLAAPF